MKHIPLALLLLITMSAHKCNQKTATAAGGGNPVAGAAKLPDLMESKWVLRSLKGSNVSMPEGATAPWLRMLKDGGKVEGFGGCNSVMGGFTLEGDRVEFPDLGSTKKYCESTQSIENGFMGALRGTKKFRMNGELLRLLSDDGSELATFTQE